VAGSFPRVAGLSPRLPGSCHRPEGFGAGRIDVSHEVSDPTRTGGVSQWQRGAEAGRARGLAFHADVEADTTAQITAEGNVNDGDYENVESKLLRPEGVTA
jgi:hypothetical protein